MGYPGDRGNPGDLPPEQSPYMPDDGGDREEHAFAPRGGTFGGPAPSWDDDLGQPTPYGSPDQGDLPPGQQYGLPPGRHDPASYDDYGDAYGQGLPPGPSGGPVQPRKRNLPLIVGAAAVAGLVLVAGGIGLSSMLGDDGGGKKAAATPTPSTTPSPTVPPLEPVKLKSRTTDPKPLTVDEVFTTKSFTVKGTKYIRKATQAKDSCKKYVNGDKLEKALKKGDCTQTLRATFTRRDKKLIGTVGILNLKTADQAEQAEKAAKAKDAYLEPLPGKSPTKTIGKGEALGTAEARGHYLIMTWVQRPDGKKVPDKDHDLVSAFGQHVIKGSKLSFALHYRETEGKPFRQ